MKASSCAGWAGRVCALERARLPWGIAPSLLRAAPITLQH